MSKPQRRKGNVQPASSSQAADLLAKTGQSVPAFVSGFVNPFEAMSAADEGNYDMIQELDVDIALVFKKLQKKDPVTREKALREVLEVLNSKDTESVTIAYNHFAVFFKKIAMDGCASVRWYSMRVASFFISTLKKAAQKQLKNIVPYMFLSTCDISTTVVQNAENALNDNFPGEKRKQALRLFAGDICRMVTDFIRGLHPLIKPQLYDTEESDQQRELRLLTQSLQMMSRISQEFDPQLEVVLQCVEEIFADRATIKRLLSMPTTVKTGVIGLAMGMEASLCASFLLGSKLAQWILSNLDSPDAGTARACFDAFLALTRSPKFFETFDVKKAIIPRILNVVRVKGMHWRHVAPFFLPTLSVISDALSNEERSTFVLSVLDSFHENLPFEASASMPQWSSAFSECVKYALNKIAPVEAVQPSCSNVVLRTADVVCEDVSDVHAPIAELIRYISEKELFGSEWNEFSQTLAMNLINKRPGSDPFSCALLFNCDAGLRSVYTSLICSQPAAVSLISGLTDVPLEYLTQLTKHNDLANRIVRASRDRPSDAPVLAKVLLRVLCVVVDSDDSLALDDSAISRDMLAQFNETQWISVEKTISQNRTAILRGAVRSWMQSGKSEQAIHLLKFASETEREELLALINDSTSHSNLRFLSEVALSRKDTAFAKDVVHKLLLFLFARDSRLSQSDNDYVVNVLSELPAPDDNDMNVITKDIMEGKTSFENVERSARLLSSLCVSDERYSKVIPEKDTVLKILMDIDSFMSAEVLFETCLSSSKYTGQICKRSDSEWKKLKGNLAVQALLYSKTATQNLETRRWALCISAVYLAVYRLGRPVYERSFGKSSELERRAADAFDSAVENDDNMLHVVLSALSSLSDPLPRVVLLALRYLAKYPAKFKVDEGMSNQSRMEVLWSLKNTRDVRLGSGTESADAWNHRFMSTSSASEFLTHVHDYSKSDTEWADKLFTIKSVSSSGFWRLNLCVLRAAGTLFEENEPKNLDAGLLDFVMCGLLTAFDSVCDLLKSSSKDSHQDYVVAWAALSLRVYNICARTVKREENEQFDKEWNELWMGNISAYILKLFVDHVSEDSTCVLTRWLCKAVWNTPHLEIDTASPTSLTESLTVQFDPALDEKGYAKEVQYLISQMAGYLGSNNRYLQFAAVHLARMLSLKMHCQENGAWDDEATKEKSIRLPVAIAPLISSERPLTVCLAMDVCLSAIPMFSSHSERVAYCHALYPPLCDSVLQIISLMPDPIPANLQKTYLTENAPLEQPDTVQRYASALLFRMVELVPALVRQWYNKLDRAASLVVNKYCRENISECAVLAELSKVKQASQSLAGAENSLKVRTVTSCGEVLADYTVDETTMRLTVRLPQDYPLSVPEVLVDKAIVTSDRANKWRLQLSSYLFYQNGSMVEGMESWRRQVDKDVSGAEACTICMMTIHTSTHQMPRVKCKQCKNKFHSNCLYKWFESSNQSSCPLCRANFT